MQTQMIGMSTQSTAPAKKKFSLPAGTTNRHQWHKKAIEALYTLGDIKYQTRTLTGIIGEDESGYVSSILGGAPVNQTAVDLYNEIGESFNWQITRDNADDVAKAAIAAIPKAKEAMPVEDQRRTREEANEQAAERHRQAEERQKAEAKKAAEVDKLAEELRAQYPWAVPASAGLSGHARASKNIKLELSQAYPGIKFSVRSDSFSMGNSVSISWQDGPSSKEVDLLVGKYQDGHFNGMEDIYEYDRSAHGRAVDLVLGRSKYVSTSREVSASLKEAIGRDLCKEYGVEYEPNARIGNQWLSDYVWQITSRTSIPLYCDYIGIELADPDSGLSDYVAKFSEPTAAPVPAASGARAHIEEHTHTKKGFLMYMVVLDDRVERDEFNDLRRQAQSMGGWYSRKWGSTPGGFAFKERETADQFLASLGGAPTPDDSGPAPGNKSKADKFRAMADKLQGDIDHKMADRLTNTPKRLKQANHARFEGERLKRTQAALYALADLHDAGEVPASLAWVNSKADVYSHMAEGRTIVPNGFHDYSVGNGKPYEETPQALALWGLLTVKTAEEEKAEKLRRMVDDLQFSKIPGYFPTPQPVIDIMIDYADIQADHKVLEPNLGSGAIADAVAPLCDEVKGFEVNYHLAEIADAKDYLIERQDFLTVHVEDIISPDRILMNPPFENLQDVDHVMHAFKFLKPGGRLVSVMSPSPFYRTDKKCEAFRQWVDDLGGEVVDLPDGSFKASGTGVATKLLIIDKQ